MRYVNITNACGFKKVISNFTARSVDVIASKPHMRVMHTRKNLYNHDSNLTNDTILAIFIMRYFR